MNKSDFALIGFLIVIISLIFIFLYFGNNKKVNNAIVYYEDKEILKIDLSKDKIYTVKGYNGDVRIKVKDKKIKVLKEDSPLHLCSKQGYISKSYESIICLPNKIVIKLENNSDIDVIAG